MPDKVCERCEKSMTHYIDDTHDHDLWLCWGCGKYKGASKVDDDFNDMIMVDPPLILELIQDKQLKVKIK